MITREDIRRTADTHIYVFGDNLLGKGYGGQAAAARGEPNAFGVPTKKSPSMSPGAFFTDDEFELNSQAILEALGHIPNDGRTLVVLPGIGTGYAELPTRAPNTYAFLRAALWSLETDRSR